MTAPSTISAGQPRRAGAPPARGALGGRNHLGFVAAVATLLATAPLSTLFDRWTWLIQSAIVVAAIAGAAAGARALRAPVWAQTGAMLGALALMLTWLYRSGEEVLFLPTLGTLEHAGALLATVPEGVASEALPIADHDGLLLLTVLGVGLVAIMVDLAAVGMRRPALAGLPMLAIYSVPVAVVPDGLAKFPFVIGVVGFLWLLGTDNLDRVRRFGRRFTGDGRDVEPWEPSPLAAAGRRLTLVGVLLALLLPLGVPGLGTGLVQRIGPGIAGFGGSGGGSPTSVNLFATLDGQLNRDVTEDLVKVTTDDPEPFYLRVGVADQISARGFDHRSPRGEVVSDGVGTSWPGGAGVTANRYSAQVEILAWDMNRLPTYATLTDVSGLPDAGQWRYDADQQVVYSEGARAGGLSYQFEYVRTELSPDALRRAAPLPDSHPIQQQLTSVLDEPRVSDLVADLTAGAATPFDQVLAIRRHFSRGNGFQYSLETGPETTGSAIVDFLFEHQAGFCVQYATAMAWMVREAGLPARVAIGFTRGSQRTGDTYVLTNHNLHAWTEVYFEGFGWVPFDPTPSASIPGSSQPTWAPDPDQRDPNLPGDGQGGPATPGPSGDGADAIPPDGINSDFGPGGAGGGSDSSPPWRLWLAAAAALLLALLAAPAVRRSLLRLRRRPDRVGRRGWLGLRSRRGRTAGPGRAIGAVADGGPATAAGAPSQAARAQAHAAWDELLDTVVDFQVPLHPAETPRATAVRLVQDCRFDVDGRSPAGNGIRLLAAAEERARYAPAPPAADGLATALRAVRKALSKQSLRPTRLRAVLLPPSTLARWRTAAADASGRAQLAMARMGGAAARLSPRRLLRPAR